VAIGLNLKELRWGFFTMTYSLKIRTKFLNLLAELRCKCLAKLCNQKTTCQIPVPDFTGTGFGLRSDDGGG
jgi:hypothetical protein